jgi:acetolactate synthase-1/2/3 large subunit
LVQVYSDAGEIGRLREIDLPIVADVGSFFESLSEATADDEWPDWSHWATEVVDVQHRRAQAYPLAESAGGIHPFHAAAEVAAVAGTEAVYAVDGGEAGQWAVQQARTSGPGRVITTGYFGGLGVGPGYAIGAQVAAPDRRVVLVTGDGSFGFHLQELDTMVHHGYPIVTVVLNNGIWGMSLHGQQIMYGPQYSAIAHLGGRDYAQIARSFGCHAERVTAFADLRPALERAFASGRPACVEIMTDPEVVSPGLVQMLGETEPVLSSIPAWPRRPPRIRSARSAARRPPPRPSSPRPAAISDPACCARWPLRSRPIGRPSSAWPTGRPRSAAHAWTAS